MGCGASTVALPPPESTPSDNTLINNNKIVANGKASCTPNGGQPSIFSGVYGGFRSNSVAPAPFPMQQHLTSTTAAAASTTHRTSQLPSEDELSAIEEVIFEQHKNSRQNTLRPLSSIQESPSSLHEDLITHEADSSSSRITKRSSVAIQTDTRSPASVVRLKSRKTQTDYDLFPEDELEVLLSRTNNRLVDMSPSLYSSSIDDLRDNGDSSTSNHKGNFIKNLNQSQRILASPVASFISSSVLLRNKRGSCDAIVQVKFICTFDQSIQTVLSLIAPTKNAPEDVNSIHNHSSLDSSASISPAITPSPELIVKSAQDIQSLVHSATIDVPDATHLQSTDGQVAPSDPVNDEPHSDDKCAKGDTVSVSSVISESNKNERKDSETAAALESTNSHTGVTIEADREEVIDKGEIEKSESEDVQVNTMADNLIEEEENTMNQSSLDTITAVESVATVDNRQIERRKSETIELNESVDCASREIDINHSHDEEIIVHSPFREVRSDDDTLDERSASQCNKDSTDRCSSGHQVNQSSAPAIEQVNLTKNVSVERRDASVQAGSPNAPALAYGNVGQLNSEVTMLLNVPRPPACKKKQMIPSIQVFKEIDQRIISESQQGASKSPSFTSSDQVSSDACNTIESLSKYLCRDLGNDLFKVRAIYRWITYNINYDANAVNESLDGLLMKKLANCTDYCRLFIEMCKILGISAVRLSGFAKGFAYRPGHWFNVNQDTLHSWCAVSLFGSWRLIDVTWGTGYVDYSGNFNKKFNEFYFLPDPEELIWSHYPLTGPSGPSYTNETWQLIDVPITLEEFNSLPKVTPYFFDCNLKLRSKLGNKDTFGCIEFRIQTEIKLQSHEPLRYKYKLYPTDQLENTSMNHFVFCQLKEDRTVGSFTIIPPSEGRYCFKIFASPEREMLQGATSLHLVAIFLLNCTRARKYLQPFPLNELPWGLTQAFYDFKLRFVSTNQTGPIIATWGGKRKVAIESPSILLISHQLFDSDGCELEVRSSILREESINKDNSMRVAFTIAPPRIGTFKLSIFGMPRPKQKGKWRLPLLATFLIDCKLVKGAPTDEDPPISETTHRTNPPKVDVITSPTASLSLPSNPQPSTSN